MEIGEASHQLLCKFESLMKWGLVFAIVERIEKPVQASRPPDLQIGDGIAGLSFAQVPGKLIDKSDFLFLLKFHHTNQLERVQVTLENRNMAEKTSQFQSVGSDLFLLIIIPILVRLLLDEDCFWLTKTKNSHVSGVLLNGNLQVIGFDRK